MGLLRTELGGKHVPYKTFQVTKYHMFYYLLCNSILKENNIFSSYYLIIANKLATITAFVMYVCVKGREQGRLEHPHFEV